MSDKKDQILPAKQTDLDTARLRQIAGVFVRYGLADWLAAVNIAAFHEDGETADEALVGQTKEARIRLALTELGPTFIKVGQLLSTMPDMIGPELANELSKLQCDVPADPPEVVMTTLLDELGRPVKELFRKFETEPWASASIAQVHRAQLWAGPTVAVKIQKGGIAQLIQADLTILDHVARIAEERSETMKSWGAARIVQEFRRTILNDLDFNRERRNIETFRKNFEDDPTVYFPITWPEYSTGRVLTMDFMDGVLGNDVEGLQQSGEDLEAFAYRGADLYLKMIFRDGFYHADPHPGNLMLLPGGVVGVVDCGTVGRIDDALRDDLEALVEAITQGDVDSLANSLWDQTKEQSDELKENIRADLAALLEDADGSVADLNVSGILMGMLQVFQKYKVAVRPGLSALLRTLVLLDGTAHCLNPTFNLQAVLEPYEAEAVRRRLDPRTMLKKARKSLREWSDFLEDLPSDLSKTLHKMRTGELHVRLEHRHLDSVVNRAVLGILTASLIVGASLLWSMKAPPLVNGVSVLGAVCYAIVIVLGWVLYRAIKESGKIKSED
ncbi:MAG: ubiquinone biosynthesis protein [Fimbriimonadaceae bacterium]|jgi:ubiquinone biosynthesis protein|nr:ubiquinone biosynthesis protein [Fimbriimonadaceae bacterium]